MRLRKWQKAARLTSSKFRVKRTGKKKHLHARGENSRRISECYTCEETPPHTWRKRDEYHSYDCFVRNTSTHVEKTAVTTLSDKKT